MITEGTGDLLEADVDALVNTVNCVGVMGKGIALQFKRKYPGNYEEYLHACKRGEVQTGHMFVVELHTLTGPRYIINFPTKQHWKSRSKIEDIQSGLRDLLEVVDKLNIKSIAVPPLGAGNGGLPWGAVEPLIRDAFTALPQVEARLYTPSNAARYLSPDPVRMTWGRATLIELLSSYVSKRLAVEPWEEPAGASHLEIQKLMYFAQAVNPQLRLTFDRGIYGPYSEQVRHLILYMEATFLNGYGDGTAPVQRLDPIAPTTEGITEANRYIDVGDEDRNVRTHIVEPVLKIIEGFEGPYGIELLASTHWVAHQEHRETAEEAWIAIRQWTSRKSRLFTQSHVEAAWNRLRETGQLAASAAN